MGYGFCICGKKQHFRDITYEAVFWKFSSDYPKWNRPTASGPDTSHCEGVGMLGDITAVDEIYIVTGRTDMRKSIDGLCAIVEVQLHMDPRRRALYLSAENVVTRLKLYSGNLMDLCCCINAWKLREDSGGREISWK